MAHVARIDEDGIVREVHVLNNSDLPNNGEFSAETEAAANAFQHSLGLEGNWKLTSYNGNFRGRYAGIGYKYDAVRNAYIPPQPYLSWIFDETTLDWVAPVPYPTDGKSYVWDEAIQNWVEVPTPQ